MQIKTSKIKQNKLRKIKRAPEMHTQKANQPNKSIKTKSENQKS